MTQYDATPAASKRLRLRVRSNLRVLGGEDLHGQRRGDRQSPAGEVGAVSDQEVRLHHGVVAKSDVERGNQDLHRPGAAAAEKGVELQDDVLVLVRR